MKKKSKYLVLLILLLISIGFAYLSSTLNIGGLTNIKGNSWNIYFNNIKYIRGQEFEEVAPTTTSNTTKTLSYTIKLLEPGDVYKFNVDVVNDGTIDAMVKVVTDTALTAEQKKYASYYVTYSDGISVDDYQLLQNHTRDTLSIMVAYKKDIKEEDLPTEDKSITVKFHLEYEQASSSAKERNYITVVNRADSSKLSVGDELAINTEHFYVVDTNNEKTTLLTKQDLNIGPNKLSDMEEGLQMTEARSIVTGAPDLPFSNTNYWVENDNLLSKYGESYPANVYDEQYNESSGENYSLAYYINQYINTLNSFNLLTIKGRLITLDEMLNLGCTMQDAETYSCTNAKSFLRESNTFWIGTAKDNLNIWKHYKNEGIITASLYNQDSLLLRPIIEIPALDI